MTDSIALYCPVSPVANDIEQLPYKGHIEIDQDGVLGRVQGQTIGVPSPYTRAKFKIRAHVDQGRRICGYIVELNAPTCLVGHNLLLANSAYRSSAAAFKLLLHWIAREGAPSEALSRLSFETVRIWSMTPTFLIDCGNHEAALNALKQFEDHSVAVLSRTDGLSSGGKRAAAVYSVGSGSCRTVYIKQREFKIKAYVKTDVIPAKSHREFPSRQVEAKVLSVAKNYLRIEVELFEKWLAKHALVCPDAWVTFRQGEETGTDFYSAVFQLVRKVLKLHQNLRQRTPRPDDLKRLVANDRDLLAAHLRGEDLRSHKSVLVRGGLLQQQKYFSALRARILNELRIDINVQWSTQSRMVSPELGSLLAYPGMFEPPTTLAEYVFCRQNATLMSRTA